ncbi:MAG: hypothetical protein K8823_161 [Cenarchaeum symbiont of Oopsacas minuta]|nr:hypothetical protein [Cenarchaeum symbiont of Oopsacas minuta]
MGYYYTICDYEYRFDASFDPCYDVMLSFEEMLQGPYGNVWVVQAKIEHDGNLQNAVLHIDPLSFETKSAHVINRKYAESIERTLFLPFSLSTEYDPKVLSVGRSWGNGPLHYGFGSEMLVRERLSLDIPTYEIGYPELKMFIQEEFPFPIRIEAKSQLSTFNNRFTVQISNESSFVALKNSADAIKEFVREDKPPSDIVINVSKHEPLSDVYPEIDSETLHMFSLVYNAIIKSIKNASNTLELIP